MTWRELREVETPPGNLYLMPRKERQGGREINGDPLGSYTKGKIKLFPSLTLTVFLRLPPPLSIFSFSPPFCRPLSHISSSSYPLFPPASSSTVLYFAQLKSLLCNFHLTITFDLCTFLKGL